MNDSIRLGRIQGIPVGLHWSIFVFAAVVATNLASFFFPTFAPGLSAPVYLLAGAAAAVLLSLSILAHEFGHALVARRHGVGTSGITLWMLGGVARLTDQPRTPRHSFNIAVAGPIVSVAIAAAAGLSAIGAFAVSLPAIIVATLGYLGVINLGLAVFNMLPALPLDGGRALQAWKWHRNGDREVATVEAAVIGRRAGFALSAIGLVQLFSGAGNGLFTIGLGLFVAMQANGERRRAEHAIAMRNRPAPAFDPMTILRTIMQGPAPAGAQPARPPAPADLIVIDPDDVRRTR
jgi:Zn-dependent protease